MSRFQRDRDAGEEQRATTLELFYDLVFVFAITQVSHLLLDDLSWSGAGKATLCLLVVWWAWNYTTWVTNELDPDSPVVRLVLLAIMLASLAMAVAIPEAFGVARSALRRRLRLDPGRTSRLPHVRSGLARVTRAAPRRPHPLLARRGGRLLAGRRPRPRRDADVLWLVALAIDYAGPIVLYWVPGRGRLGGGTWEVETTHFAERFQLFMIIALGETIVLTGATTSQLDLDAAPDRGLAVAFLGTAALWWLYFDYVANIAQRRLELARTARALARDGYTYLHVVMVAGSSSTRSATRS